MPYKIQGYIYYPESKYLMIVKLVLNWSYFDSVNYDVSAFQKLVSFIWYSHNFLPRGVVRKANLNFVCVDIFISSHIASCILPCGRLNTPLAIQSEQQLPNTSAILLHIAKLHVTSWKILNGSIIGPILLKYLLSLKFIYIKKGN